MKRHTSVLIAGVLWAAVATVTMGAEPYLGLSPGSDRLRLDRIEEEAQPRQFMETVGRTDSIKHIADGLANYLDGALPGDIWLHRTADGGRWLMVRYHDGHVGSIRLLGASFDDFETWFYGGDPDTPSGLIVEEVADGATRTAIRIAWDPITNAGDGASLLMYEARIRLDGEETWFDTWTTTDTTFLHRYPTVGRYVVAQVRTINTRNNTSDWTAADSALADGDATAPAEPTGLTATGGLYSVSLDWTPPADADLAYHDIWRSTSSAETGGVPDAGSIIARTPGPEDYAYYDYVGAGSVTRYYWIRAVDDAGNESAWVGPESATTASALEADIDDNAVTAGKIATGAVDSTKVEDDGLSNDDIAWLDAGKIIVGLIRAGIITADSITTGTLTGRTVQTAESGMRVVIDGATNRLTFYNASGQLSVAIRDTIDEAGTGSDSGIEMGGNGQRGMIKVRGSNTSADSTTVQGGVITTSGSSSPRFVSEYYGGSPGSYAALQIRSGAGTPTTKWALRYDGSGYGEGLNLDTLVIADWIKADSIQAETVGDGVGFNSFVVTDSGFVDVRGTVTWSEDTPGETPDASQLNTAFPGAPVGFQSWIRGSDDTTNWWYVRKIGSSSWVGVNGQSL